MTENKRFIPIFDGIDKRVVGAKDNGEIISFMDMFDLLNEQEKTIEQIKKESKEFKRHIMSNIELAEKQLKTGEGNQEHIIIYKNVCEEVLGAMPSLLLWDGDVE